mmetsp:Transcript_8266/g.14166  ORF Transcript_8266/g.14166 Transcript_8266/m.14166 type:complete len:537 (-) Transcript_8266:224-1834(-)|eukprot:CAMPEP_0196652346 /NCGR_PEP_ID=MMETSP1086-20130531/1594_1 /TAXON_ID=77921 /ORGANISM="Cyanoptyche  gloeocystis , Strain SAG4.97" /LENGTH=536 /DNA_ID=CAMNT_0041982831 /DNA_START=183 /DNA_END=1793 /DNA_ORIENTATION=+
MQAFLAGVTGSQFSAPTIGFRSSFLSNQIATGYSSRASSKKSTRLCWRYWTSSNQTVQFSVSCSDSTVKEVNVRPEINLNGDRSAEIDCSESEQETKSCTSFDWRRQWYAVLCEEDLPKNEPYAFTLFDEPMVLWVDPDGKINCVRDRCPHRLAPLSEGRLEKGRLECGYHGWQFSGAGECVRIPQLDEGVPIGKRACVSSFQAALRHGLVWVWACPDERADPDTIFNIDEVYDKLNMQCFRSFSRDVPIDHTVLLENVFDVSHAPFSHNGVLGKRADGKSISWKLVEGVNGGSPAGFAIGENPVPMVWFRSPATVQYRFMYFHCVPLGSNRSRLISKFFRPKKPKNSASTGPSSGPRPPIGFLLYVFFQVLRPRWLDHMERNLILDQDLSNVYREDLLTKFHGDWRRAYYSPTTADLTSVSYYNWLEKSLPTLPNASSRYAPKQPLPREQLLDRYANHVAHCSSCKVALHNAKRLKLAGAALSAACLIASALPTVTPLVPPPVLLSLAIIFALTSKLSWETEKRLGYFPNNINKH